MFVLLGFCCFRSLEWRGAGGILSEDFLGVCLSGIKILMLIESKSINFASQVKAKSFRTVLQTIASCTATELRFPIFHKILKKSHFQRKFSPLTNLQVFQVIAFRFDFWWLGLLFVCLFVCLLNRAIFKARQVWQMCSSYGILARKRKTSGNMVWMRSAQATTVVRETRYTF